MVLCGVCQRGYDRDELNENFRGMLECPQCGTELEKNKGHSGNIKRDRHKHKK